jgi:hypothetical protein
VATLLEDIVSHIIAHGFATADGVDIFRDFSPDAPDDVVVLYEYAGNPTSKGVNCRVRSVQVTVRSISASSAQTKVNALYQLLDTAEASITYFTASRYAIVVARQTPYKIMVDANKRLIYGFNMAVTTYQD